MLCLYIIVNEEKYIDYFPPYLYYSGNRQLLLLLVWKPKAHSPVNATIDRTRLNIVNGILGIIDQFFFVFWSIIPRIPLTMFSRVLPKWPYGATTGHSVHFVIR